MISGMGVLKSVKWSAITCLPSLVLLYKNEFCQSWQYISTVQVFKQPLNLCVIYLPFKFKEFGNTHAVIKLLSHKSYHTNADPPNSLCKQCQQQYSVNKKMWLRERESKSEILCEERDGERRKRNIQIDNLLMIAVAFIFVFFVIAALKIQTATPCQAWQIRTIDQWTWVRMTWHIRHARIKRINTAACVGTELLDTTLMPYPASLARRSSEETHRKDW